MTDIGIAGEGDVRRFAEIRVAADVDSGRSSGRSGVVLAGITRQNVARKIFGEIVEVFVNVSVVGNNSIVGAADRGAFIPLRLICISSRNGIVVDNVFNLARNGISHNIAAGSERDFGVFCAADSNDILCQSILEVISCATRNGNDRVAFDTLNGNVVTSVRSYRDRSFVHVARFDADICVVYLEGNDNTVINAVCRAVDSREAIAVAANADCIVGFQIAEVITNDINASFLFVRRDEITINGSAIIVDCDLCTVGTE